MKKMLMMATTAAMIEQFNKNNILILLDLGYEVHIVGNFEKGNPISEERLEEFKKWITEKKCKWFNISSTRKPADYDNIRAYKQVVDLINKYKYEFIHCHTPIGSVIARCASHKTHTPVIYTAHGFHFYKGAPLKNWILYYPIEWVCSWWTDILITINNEDYERAKKHFHMKKLEKIPGVGVDIDKFSICKVDREKKCMEIGISSNKFIMLSVGELQKRKNHIAVINALHKVDNSDIVYLIVGQGELHEDYELKIKEYGLEKKIKLLGFRDDIAELCKTADCFVFPSLQEGLPVALMEAMASGLPVICSQIRGNTDLIEEGKGGYLFQANSIDQLKEAICEMMHNTEFRQLAGITNREKIKKYDTNRSQNLMKKIYEGIIE